MYLPAPHHLLQYTIVGRALMPPRQSTVLYKIKMKMCTFTFLALFRGGYEFGVQEALQEGSVIRFKIKLCVGT